MSLLAGCSICLDHTPSSQPQLPQCVGVVGVSALCVVGVSALCVVGVSALSAAFKANQAQLADKLMRAGGGHCCCCLLATAAAHLWPLPLGAAGIAKLLHRSRPVADQGAVQVGGASAGGMSARGACDCAAARHPWCAPHRPTSRTRVHACFCPWTRTQVTPLTVDSEGKKIRRAKVTAACAAHRLGRRGPRCSLAAHCSTLRVCLLGARAVLGQC